MTMNEKQRALFDSQKTLLDTFLAHGAISKAQYQRSLGDLRVKMGIDGEGSPDTAAPAVTVCRAVRGDMPQILSIYADARERMRAAGNPTQWGNDRPKTDTVAGDIAKGQCYLIKQGDCVLGVFAFFEGPDPTYAHIENGAWPNDDPYGVIHRIAAAPDAHGVLAAAVDFAFSRVRVLRVDTHRDNLPMRGALQKLGFTPCGTIFTDDGTERIAFCKTKSQAGAR